MSKSVRVRLMCVCACMYAYVCRSPDACPYVYTRKERIMALILLLFISMKGEKKKLNWITLSLTHFLDRHSTFAARCSQYRRKWIHISMQRAGVSHTILNADILIINFVIRRVVGLVAATWLSLNFCSVFFFRFRSSSHKYLLLLFSNILVL